MPLPTYSYAMKVAPILGIASLALVLTSCEEDGRQAEVGRFALELGEKRLADVDQRLEVFHARASKLKNGSEELLAAQANLAKVESKTAAVVSEKMVLVAQVEAQVTANQDYLDDARMSNRLAARGEKIPRLALNSGRTYDDLTITKVTDVGLEIRHSLGAARVPFNELSPAMQDRFLYDPEVASLVISAERERAARYAVVADAAYAKVKAEEAVLSEKRAERESELALARLKASTAIASNTSRIESSTSRLGSSSSTTFRVHTRRSSGYYRRSNYYYPSRSYYNYRPTTPTYRPAVPTYRPTYNGCPTVPQ